MSEKTIRLILVMLLMGIGFYYLAQQSVLEGFKSSKSPKKAGHSFKNSYDAVNYHIQKVNNKQRIDRLKVERENANLPREPGPRQPLEETPLESSNFDIPETPFEEILDDLKSPASKGRFRVTSEEQIRSWLEQKQLTQEYNKMYKEEYVKAFVENAARQGYEVKVDDQLRIVEVKVLAGRVPQSEVKSEKGLSKGGR